MADDTMLHRVALCCKLTVVRVWLEDVKLPCALGLLLSVTWLLSSSHHVSEVLAAIWDP